MKISKALFFVMVLVMISALFGCAPAVAPTEAPAAPAEPAAPAATEAPAAPAAAPKTYKDLTVGFIQTGSEGGWRTANTGSFKETAEQLGINLKFYDAQNKQENQISAFRNFIADKVDVIILAALETTGYEAVLQEAKDAGIVVVLEDRRIDAPEDLYATYIGSDFIEEGRKGADEMCKLLEGMEKKNVVELVGNVGSSAAKDRGTGFREKMGDCGITITESQTAEWDATKGKAVMEAWLKKSKDIQGVFAQNDEMGLGAAQAIKEAGLKPGIDIKIITFDATAGVFKAMIAGDINTTIECNPLLAPQVYEAALKAVNGETLPKWVPSQEGVFYAADAETILPTRKY
ncbi:MAG: ABC transporter substrate-binding protein [Anaerolineaceae bacterium]